MSRYARKVDASYDKLTPHRSRKDTKRWCGGHPGREHEPEWGPRRQVAAIKGLNQWLSYACRRCGRELDWCLPWGERRPGKRGCLRGCSGKHRVQP